MNYVIVEGTIQHGDYMSEEILKEHMAYTQRAINQGKIFLSGLKTDESGGLFIIKAEKLEEIEEYLAKEPLFLHGIQTYRMIPIDCHVIHEEGKNWFIDSQ